MSVRFEDYSIQVKAAIENATHNFLEEAASLVEDQAIDNSPVDTGQLKGSFAHTVDDSKNEAQVGNTAEHSIYVEMGTGEYALKGNGRQGGWRYQDDKGEWHYTTGQKPVRMLHNAFNSKKSAIINEARRRFGELGD